MARKVLFVDDDEILQLVMGKVLAVHSKRFQIVAARDGFDALKRMELHGFSLIVIDLMMPRMDGLSSLSHIRETYPDVPVLLISAKPKEEMAYLAEMEGIVGYLEKPFGGREIAGIIEDVLHKEDSGGTMRGVSPTMFLQLMEMESKTCTIRILASDSGEGGVLYLKQGKIIDARIGTLTGIDAARKIFTWDEVNIYFQNSCPERENRIDRDMQAIIMESLALRDEADHCNADNGDEGENAGGVEQAGDGGAGSSAGHQQETASLQQLKCMIRAEVENFDWLCAVYHDPCLERIMNRLRLLGEQAQFGDLQVGYVDDGESADRVLVPGDGGAGSSAVLQVKEGAPLGTIIDLLRFRNEQSL